MKKTLNIQEPKSIFGSFTTLIPPLLKAEQNQILTLGGKRLFNTITVNINFVI